MSTCRADHSPDLDGSDSRKVMVGQSFFIHLWEDRTRGEQWVPSYDTGGLALLSDEFLRIASNNAVENGQRIFEFKAAQPGVYQLIFEKRMGWKFTAEDRRLFRIEAGPPSRN
ncbi:protease inhibitor I42 family protein [Nitrospira sp. BLG_2]|uniref:protease inhibitor I42 family protein n=1 Tax=Nitrospira sp. BLG_2 TaxID=3397507 RepID=UPI003B9BD6FD